MHAMQMDLNPGIDLVVRIGATTTGRADEAANAAHAERATALDRATSQRVGNRLTPALAWRVEHALFAVTLAAIGYLEALALLAEAV